MGQHQQVYDQAYSPLQQTTLNYFEHVEVNSLPEQYETLYLRRTFDGDQHQVMHQSRT